jgi:hypothetical protein
MEITERFENRDSFLHWFIIASLTGVEITAPMKSNPMNITMQINGEEVNPLNSIDRLEQQFERMVRDKACSLVEDIKYKLTERLNTSVGEVLEEIKADDE